MKNARKVLLLVLCLVLVVSATVMGTLAYLTDQTAEVKNTFTVGKVDIDLYETKDGEHVMANQYQLIPGAKYTKDPTVEVKADSEDCYLFVKFQENGNASTYINYTSNLTAENGWTQVPSETNVWYREVKKADTTKSWHLLAADEITINAETVTNNSMNTAQDAELVYTAYACQSAGLTLAEAWTQAQAQANP